jgi:hypothetical protein
MQAWEDGGRGVPASQYPPVRQEQMAVLDYVSGNTDRHPGNYLTAPGGDPIAIDHGYSYPEGPADSIRSTFVGDHLGTPLSPDTLARVRALDPDQVRGMLTATGLSPVAVDGAVARLQEIQDRGMITGEAWRGPIVDAHWATVRGPLP